MNVNDDLRPWPRDDAASRQHNRAFSTNDNEHVSTWTTSVYTVHVAMAFAAKTIHRRECLLPIKHVNI